jgi:DNA helicase HerA-like ATPase
MNEYVGLGEARMIGIFGKSGAGKSWLAAYILAGFAKNKNMGILILDPQGEFANNFPTSNLPFQQILKYAAGRELNIISSDEIRLSPENKYDVALFTKKFSEAYQLFPTTPEKYKEFLNHLYEQIVNTKPDQTQNCINPVACYTDVMKKINDGKFDEAARSLGLTAEELKNKLQQHSNMDDDIARQIWIKFIDSVKDILQDVFAGEDIVEKKTYYLNKLKKREDLLKDFKAYLSLFDTSQGKTVDDIVNLLLTQKRVIIFDLSNLGKRFSRIDDIELKAFFMNRIIGKIREKAEQQFRASGNNLVNVLIAMDEAHNYVGTFYSHLPEDLKQLKKQITKNVKETRKYGIGWLFITQTTVDFDKEIYRQLHDYFFLYGLGVGADLQHMKEVVPKEFVEHYRSLPNPKQTNNYWAMHTGSLNVINTATAATFIRLPTPSEFLELNFNMTLEELKQKEKEMESLKDKPVD